ncbi:MAG TPA: hypothetical protein VM532_06395 [Burkholderiales bacterium]|nr:hypothetical protein [Burkholderiales bacterium]
MKILFLAQLKEYTPFSSDASFEAIFDSSRFNAEVFDRWWTIRRLMVDESAEGLYPILRQFSHLVDRTENDRVNQWLDWVRASSGGDNDA